MNTSSKSSESSAALYVGRRVSFTRYGKVATGTVVKETIFSWCPGANSITVLCDETKHLVGLPTCSGAFTLIPSAGIEMALVSARAAYKAHLSQYPIWAERFAAGQEVSF